MWLPLEIWADLLVDNLSVKEVCRFTQANCYCRFVGRSDAVWGRIFHRAVSSGAHKRRGPVARVPKRVATDGKTLLFHSRYIRLLYWFYETEIRTRGNQYPLSLTMHRPRKLKALEDTGLIPPSWCRKRSAPEPRVSCVYQRRSPKRAWRSIDSCTGHAQE